MKSTLYKMKGKSPHLKYRDDAFIRIMKRKRKRKKQAIIKIVIAILILIVSLFLYGGVFTKHTAVAFDYDTCLNLWDLADKHCPGNIDKRDFIEAVVKLNNMDGYTVYPERVYQYPIYEEVK